MKKQPKKYEAHPIANLIPPMEKGEFQEFTKDIVKNGLEDPIVLYEDMILDGRHRYRACDLAEIKPRFIQYKGNDPLGFVLSHNLHRRHMDASQRAILGANIATMRQGERTDIAPSANAPKVGENGEAPTALVSQAEAAEALGVSTRSVTAATKIIKEAPKLAKQVASGKISLNAATKQLAEQQAADEPVIDKTGWKVPKELQPFWARRSEVQKYLASITSMKTQMLALQEAKDPLFDNISFSQIVERLNYVHMLVRKAELYTVCTTCQGRARKNCNHCKGRGFLSKFMWEAVPEEIRAIRQKGSAPVKEEEEAA